MLNVGAFEAKTHLSALLDRVERGEEIIITRHGKSIARLVPEKKLMDKDKFDDIVRQLKEVRKGSTLGGATWKELRDEGRKW